MNPTIVLRPITENDLAFLFHVYASTRAAEMAATGWAPEEVTHFLSMQFDLQRKHYQTYYHGADFSVILCGDAPAGRLYVHRTSKEIRIIDIALLPEWQGQGVGRELMSRLVSESEQTCLPLTLHVEFNNPIREYYTRLGFVQGELRGVYHFMEYRPKSLAEAI